MTTRPPVRRPDLVTVTRVMVLDDVLPLFEDFPRSPTRRLAEVQRVVLPLLRDIRDHVPGLVRKGIQAQRLGQSGTSARRARALGQDRIDALTMLISGLESATRATLTGTPLQILCQLLDLDPDHLSRFRAQVASHRRAWIAGERASLRTLDSSPNVPPDVVQAAQARRQMLTWAKQTPP